MIHRRILAATAFAALFAAGLVASNASADDEKPCLRTEFKFDQVAKACKTGGRKAAQKLMKAAVKKAKAAGKDMKCTECHPKANETHKLKDGAADKLKPWL